MKRIVVYWAVVAGMATAVTLKASQKRNAIGELALKNVEVCTLLN